MNKYSIVDLTVSDCSDDDFVTKRSLTKDIEEERTLKNNFKRPKIKEEEIQHINEALTQQEDDEDDEEINKHHCEGLYHNNGQCGQDESSENAVPERGGWTNENNITNVKSYSNGTVKRVIHCECGRNIKDTVYVGVNAKYNGKAMQCHLKTKIHQAFVNGRKFQHYAMKEHIEILKEYI